MKTILVVLLVFFSSISFAKVTLEKLDEYDKFHRQYALLYLSESIEKEDAESFQDVSSAIYCNLIPFKSIFNSFIINFQR